jgi:hypothetical protein
VKKNVKVVKTENIPVRCTAQQKAVLEKVAVEEGLGVDAWLLQAGLLAAQQGRQ